MVRTKRISIILMTGARLVRGLTVNQVYVGSKPARPAKTHRGVEQWLARQAI